ncbi:exosortase C-terminal domain/associated protein EpsI [Desulfobulbus elongatus]|uniref:exosortase C-terminal domain/associated protein EpsI n=1 Tax=Desulfobulbus elongatus TaxID=53332 RepID=UPI0004841747|nr:EpsI domain-containing exosortase [Desulfobulbus elongatus]
MTSHSQYYPNQNPSSFQACTFLFSLLFCLVVGFWPAIQKMVSLWNFDDSNYCYLVVPLFLYLCWEKRTTFNYLTFNWKPWSLAVYALAFLLVVVGELGSIVTLTFIGLWFFLFAIGLSLYGNRIRKLWFELLILAFIVPFPPFILRSLTFNLKMLASTLSVHMLRVLDVSVLQNGNIIDLGVRQFQVVDACSGLRYVLAMFLLALLIGHFYSRDLVRRAILLMFVLPVAVLVNSFRIFITAVFSINGYPELADNFFHDFAGFALFLCAAVILWFVTSLLNTIGPTLTVPQIWSTRAKDDRGRAPNRAIVFLCCLLLLGGGWIAHKLPSTHIIPERQSFLDFPLEIGGWEGTREHIPDDILAELWSDDYVKMTFSHPDRPGQQIHLLIPYYAYQGTLHAAHAPQSCILGSGWALSGSQDRTVAVADKEHITVRTMLFQKEKTNLVANYFFLGRGRTTVSPWMNKLYLIWDAFKQHRTDGAIVRVEMVVPDNKISDRAYEDLDHFIAALWNILPRYIPG